MTTVGTAFLNYRDGGLLPGSGFDFDPLRRAFTPLVGHAPALIALTEAQRWANDGGAGVHGACAVLDDLLSRPYTGLPGWHRRGDYGPAIVWDPQVLRLETWTGLDHETNAVHERNTATFAIRGNPVRLRMIVRHYSFDSGTERLAEAEQDAEPAGDGLPTLLVGDLNATGSGPHLPQRDWALVPPHKRRHKAMLDQHGQWVADTRALDALIGEWNNAASTRAGGAGWRAVAELAHAAGVPAEEAFRPTTNSGASTGRLLTSWYLANPAAIELIDPTSYQVHQPTAEYPAAWSLDHRLITTTLTA
ncbi:endonuclease/exonuclease/phosphatase family protein [Lentzea chajnantorensis]